MTAMQPLLSRPSLASTPQHYEDIKILRDSKPCELADKVSDALKNAASKTDIDSSGIYTIPGMSGKKYRYFINTLIHSMSDPRYLEVGSYAGSTLCAAVHNNKVWAVAIDNWSLFGGPKKVFMNNLLRYRSEMSEVLVIEADFRAVDYTQMQRGFNVYLFDGPHEKRDQYDGLAMALPSLDKQFVFIVDDWNWGRVQEGTYDAIGACDLRILFAASIKTSKDGTQPMHNIGATSNWHNGYFISVLEKKG